ncbi:MAG: T9SS type A sorting domain-containing protein, partial [bacterium]|nr:T9SS type A sorting domain-containing protein [bacterium]
MFTIKAAQLHLYNVLGQHTISVLNQELARGSYSIPLNGKSLSSGLYFYRLTL